MDDIENEFDNTLEDSERSMLMDKNKNGAREGKNGATATASNGQAKNLPVHTVRIGGVKVAVWKNQTSNGPMHNCTLVRTYKNQAGEWAESHSLSRDDLLLAAKALDLAHTFIVQTETAARAQQQQEQSDAE